MMQFFRRVIRSRAGAVIGLLLLGVIALAFAAGDIKNMAQNGSLGQGGDDAADVGDATLATTEVQNRVQRVFDANRQETPALTINEFLAAGGFGEVVNQLIDGLAISEFGRENGMRVGKKLVDAEIAGIPAFQDATGKFSQTQFSQLLQRERISEMALRDDISRQILQRQLLDPAGLAGRTPQGMVGPYASMLLEKRAGSVAVLPSEAFIPNIKANEATLRSYYAANGDRFSLPEQRRIRYAMIDNARFVGKVKASDAEIAQYFKANAAQYGASETRTVRQLILPSESAAKALAAKIGPSLNLDAAAQQAGLAAAKLSPMTRQAFAAQASDAAATQVFAAAKGALAGPVRIDLGWALYSVDDVQTTGAQTLDSVRSEIATKLTDEKIKQALADLSNKIDGQVGDGATFDEAVKSNGLTAGESPALTAEGRSIANPQAQPDPALAPIVKAGFAMEQGDDAQIVQVVPDKLVALVSLGQVTPAGPPPFAQVRPAVERTWLIAQGATRAKAAADALRQKVMGGAKIADAVAATGIKLPPVERIGAQRSELGQQGQRVPEAMVTLFSMKQGTTRVLPLPRGAGYIVMHLDEIIPGDAGKNQQLLGATAQGLSGVLSSEYARQFQSAMRGAVGVKRNDAALARVEADMRKGSAPE